MHYMGWIVAGFVCLGVSGSIEWIGDRGANPSERMPYYLAALGLLMGAAFCFVKGGKEVWYAIMVQAGDAPPKEKVKAGARPARRTADSDHQTATDQHSTFDADEALARYMARRDQAADEEGTIEVSAEPVPQEDPQSANAQKAAPLAQPFSREPRPAVRPTFGRKVS
ncbi:MAG: hypothetical protein AAF697_05315 [Pseudomonadota bacterium]